MDPGLKACGLSIVQHDAMGWSRLTSHTVSEKGDFVSRLRAIARDARLLIHAGIRSPGVDWIGIEDPLYVIAGKQAKRETDFNALRLMAVLGMACDWGFALSVPVILVEPSEVKRAVGAPGTADKGQIQRCVRALVRDCGAADFDEHQADATATAIASYRHLIVDGALRAAREKKHG